MLTGRVQKKTPDGRLVYEKDGMPVPSDAYEIIGYGVPDFTGGLENSFTWKNINLSFLIDFKSGGDIYSGTNAMFTWFGLSYESLEGRDPNNPMKVIGQFKRVLQKTMNRFMKILNTLCHRLRQEIIGMRLSG